MRKFFILAIAAMMTVLTLAGCAVQVKTYTDSGQTIDMGVKKEFIIALGSNPTTGYMWQESFDTTYLELVEQLYKPSKPAQGGTVGGGGVEYFWFKALKAGKTEITLVYKRPGEETKPEDVTRVFTINIQ